MNSDAGSPETLAAAVAESVKKRFGKEVTVSPEIPRLEALARIHSRSVCRRYREEAVGDDLVDLLCATALSSPSKSDLQQASIIRVCDPEKREAIHALMPGSPWIQGAPEFLVFCGDHSRVRRIFEQRGAEYPNDHLDSFFNAAVDAGIVLSLFVQAAHLVELGCCPISEIREHCEAITEILELPRWVFPVAGLTLGYPVELEPLSPRIGLECLSQVDGYDTARVDAQLAEYDQRRVVERPYRRQRDPERFGTVEAYGWSEDKFRQYSTSQRADFGAFVRKQGFCLE